MGAFYISGACFGPVGALGGCAGGLRHVGQAPVVMT